MKSHLFIIKMILFKIDVKKMLGYLIKNVLYKVNITVFINIFIDIIQIDNQKYVKYVSKNFVHINLKTCWGMD